MAKHLLLKKQAGSGWNLCDPQGGAGGEGKTRDGLNQVLNQSKADVSKTRVAKAPAWSVTITDGKKTRTEEVQGADYKGAERAVKPKLRKGENIQSIKIASTKKAMWHDVDRVIESMGLDPEISRAVIKEKGDQYGISRDQISTWYADDFIKEVRVRMGLKQGSDQLSGPHRFLTVSEVKAAYQQGVKEGRFVETAEGIQDTKDNTFIPWSEEEKARGRGQQGDTGDYDFYKADPGSPAGEEEWIAMKEMGIIGKAKNAAEDEEDNPMCKCGHRFYEHNEQGYCDICDPQSETKGGQLCGGFTLLNESPKRASLKTAAVPDETGLTPVSPEVAQEGYQLATSLQDASRRYDWANERSVDVDYNKGGQLWPYYKIRSSEGKTHYVKASGPAPVTGVRKSGEMTLVLFGPDGISGHASIDPANLARIKQLQPESGAVTFRDEQGIVWGVTLTDSGDYQFNSGSPHGLRGSIPSVKLASRPRSYKEAGRGPTSFAVPEEFQNQVALALAQRGLEDFVVGEGEFPHLAFFHFQSEEEREAAVKIIRHEFRAQIEGGKGLWAGWTTEAMAPDPSTLPELHGQPENVPLSKMNSEKTAGRMDKLRTRTQLPEMEQERPGAVCGDCGRTVTEGEYSYGGSKCCDAGVVAEEEYGRTASARTTVKKPRAPEKKYPDTADGAIQMLRDYADPKQVRLEGATARPDPSVQGVWEVKMKNGDRAIVYLAGYREPMGQVRATNDFEIETQDDRDFNAQQRKSRRTAFDKRVDPRMDRWMAEYLKLDPLRAEPFPEWVAKKREAEDAKAKGTTAGLRLIAKFLNKD